MNWNWEWIEIEFKYHYENNVTLQKLGDRSQDNSEWNKQESNLSVQGVNKNETKMKILKEEKISFPHFFPPFKISPRKKIF